MDQQSGFGRVGADLLGALRDDYGAAPTLLFGLQPAPPPRSHVRNVVLNESIR